MTHSTSVEYKSRSKCLTCSLSAERKPWNSKIQLKGLSDLCPVTVLICLASMLCSESTVTDVARTQWLVRWGAIPVDVDMFFIMFSSVLLPTGGLQYHTSSFCGCNFVDTSLGRWNKACRQPGLQVRIQVFKEAFKGFHRAALWIRNLKHFTIGFVRVICQTTLMIFGCEVAAKLIVTSPLRCTPKNQRKSKESPRLSLSDLVAQ